MGDDVMKLWASYAWRDRAVAWLDAQLAAAGCLRMGPVTQVVLQPWSTLLRATTDRGDVWLKALGDRTVVEASLYPLLQKLAPATVLAPLAIEAEESWLLLPDAGVPLAAAVDATELPDVLARVLPQYAQLQLDLMPHVAPLLALGVGDMRAPVMLARFDEAVAAVEPFVVQHAAAPEREAWTRLSALRERFAEWCAQLAAAPVPPSLDHNDLHAGNVFVQDDQLRLCDWGDAIVAHPFTSLLVALGDVQLQLGLRDDDPRLLRIRDAYLEPFERFAPRAALIETVALACRIGKVTRALTYQYSVAGTRALELRRLPLRCLLSLLDPSYLGCP